LVSRSPTGSARRLRFKDVTLDCETLLLRVAASDSGQELPLKEAQLMRLFIEKAGICLSRDEIKKAVWRGVTVTSRNIDSYVSKLRTRLSHADATIESVYGGGYVFR
jgi:DNA-binding response OmpR family regulator